MTGRGLVALLLAESALATPTGSPTMSPTTSPTMSPSFSRLTCTDYGHGNRVEGSGITGTGPKTHYFLMPGAQPARFAETRCVQIRIQSEATVAGQCTQTPELQVRLAYAQPGTERADYCNINDDGTNVTDCEARPTTTKGSCLYVREGRGDQLGKSSLTYKSKCVQIGKRHETDGSSRNVNPRNIYQSTTGDIVSSEVIAQTQSGNTPATGNSFDLTGAQEAFWFKAHGWSKAYFFVEYEVITNQNCPWQLAITFNGRAYTPEESYCFSMAEAATTFPIDKDPNRVQTHTGDWAANVTNFKFDPPEDLEAFLPRSGNFKIMQDKVTVSTGNTYTWDLGLGPVVDIDCIHLSSTAADLQQVLDEKPGATDVAGSVCMQSQYGHDGMVNSKPDSSMTGTALNNFLSGKQEQWSLNLVDAFDCSVYTDPTKFPADPLRAFRSQTYADMGFPCTNSGCLWEQCCQQTEKTPCMAITSTIPGTTTVVNQCVWADTFGKCMPAVGRHAVNVKPIVGINGDFTFAASIGNMEISSYVSLADIVREGYFGSGNRRWLLEYTNNYGKSTQPCLQAVTLGYKGTVNGGICEPAGRQFCDARADACATWNVDNPATDTSTYPRFWSAFRDLRQDVHTRSDTQVTTTDSNGNVHTITRTTVVTTTFPDTPSKRYRTCNCLKEKEICYRQVGCLSTKRYQLILQNCLEAGCGNFCNHED
eukprot:TRINITY_DN2324_c0_g1_i1.p1 TRINITY_DN2324_c0_g1~~TRINITY_DN2324_c0_g1_i1.p1  ORF type:complete len:707 (+),score=229.93 TRINITY_DN2324_c0_g1_i1:145-2265(+)